MWPCSVGHKVFESVESCHLSGDGAPATLASVCGVRTPPCEERDGFWTKTQMLCTLCFLTHSTCPFLSAVLKSMASEVPQQMGSWFPSSPPDTPPVYSFTLWAPLPTLAFNYRMIAETFLTHKEAACSKCSCWSQNIKNWLFLFKSWIII